MKNILRKVLGWLPFDGSKTKIGLIVALFGVVKIVLPEFGPVGDAVVEFLRSDQGVALLGAITTAVGLFHKRLKKEIV